jgi:sulfide:quinone oxidoreductase
MTSQSKIKIVVLGGGFAGLESAFYIRYQLGARVQITLVSDKDYFVYKPNTIYIPFGMNPEKLKIPLSEPTSRKGIQFIKDTVMEINPSAKKVITKNGELSYDFLFVSTGAGMWPQEIPGLAENAQTIFTLEAMIKLREVFLKLEEDLKSGLTRKVLFAVPQQNKCSGPLYEMVLMLDTWLRRKGLRNKAAIHWSTYEDSFVQAFGPRLNEVVSAEFSNRGIQAIKSQSIAMVEKGKIQYQSGLSETFDLLVSFPPYAASTHYSQLPIDERGFIRTNLETRQVENHPEIYAIGDTGDFPVKQAFLAFLQADAAASHLTAQILGKPIAERFLPTSMCVMEQFNKATFAQVPLRLTGDPAKPLEVIVDSPIYKVGSSPAWRIGKAFLGFYLPWRFKAGNPFHAGLPWKAANLGLKVMSALLAS